MSPGAFEQWLMQKQRPPLLMGVLNATPDSFSDGGAFTDSESAAEHGLQMLADGADLVDVGGESTRPGSLPVEAEEQIRRTLPTIRRLAASGATVSIDTTSAVVARRAIDAGATVINDVSAGRSDPEMLSLASRTGVAIVLMHMQGEPRSMQVKPAYDDVVAEVLLFLRSRAAAAVAAGVATHRVLLDVGIGFGKTIDHNLLLLANYARFRDAGFPTVLGTSRKSFIGTLTRQPIASERIIGTAATNAWGLANGADILRVHDVRESREVRDVIQAIRTARPPPSNVRT